MMNYLIVRYQYEINIVIFAETRTSLKQDIQARSSGYFNAILFVAKFHVHFFAFHSSRFMSM